jgi:prepilin-type N-terminal cleavage/methylation domain-containing protein
MTKNKQRGFTIIEVALVLAVAALIFLVVFLAVPALQRNQRDDARKRDVSNTVQAVTNAVANTNTALTAGLVYNSDPIKTTTLGQYLDKMSSNVDYVGILAKPATLPYDLPAGQKTASITIANSTNITTPGTNAIAVYLESKCEGNTKLVAASKRSAARVIQVENGGDGKYYCTDANYLAIN